MILLEIGGRFPWVRRRPPVQPGFHPAANGPALSEPAPPTHRSWVQTYAGIGWLDHHSPEGFWVRLAGGEMVCVQAPEAAAPPDDVQ